MGHRTARSAGTSPRWCSRRCSAAFSGPTPFPVATGQFVSQSLEEFVEIPGGDSDRIAVASRRSPPSPAFLGGAGWWEFVQRFTVLDRGVTVRTLFVGYLDMYESSSMSFKCFVWR